VPGVRNQKTGRRSVGSQRAGKGSMGYESSKSEASFPVILRCPSEARASKDATRRCSAVLPPSRLGFAERLRMTGFGDCTSGRIEKPQKNIPTLRNFLTGAQALLPSTHPASLKGRLHAVTDAGRGAVAMRRGGVTPFGRKAAQAVVRPGAPAVRQ
jgi:hypothetical protein